MRKLIYLLIFFFSSYCLLMSQNIKWQIGSHIAPILAGALSKDNALIAVIADKVPVVFDIKTGKKILELTQFNVFSLDISDDGKYLLFYDNTSNNMIVYDIQNKLIKWRNFLGLLINQVKFVPGSTKFVYNQKVDSVYNIYLYDYKKDIRELTYNFHSFRALKTSPDGNLLMVLGDSLITDLYNQIPKYNVIVSEIYTGNVVFWQPVQLRNIADFCFSNNSKMFATCSHYDDVVNESVRIWDIFSKKEIKEIKHPDVQVSKVCFSYDDKSVYYITNNSSLNIADIQTGKYTNKGDYFAERYSSRFIQSIDNHKFLLTFSNKIQIWDSLLNTKTNEYCIYEGNLHSERINTIAISPDSRKILTGSNDGLIKCWDADSGQFLFDLKQNDFPVNNIIFTKDGKKLITSSTAPGRQIDVWDFENRTFIKTIYKVDNSSVIFPVSLNLSNDEKFLTAAMFYDSVFIFDMETGNLIKRLKDSMYVNLVKFSPDDKYIFTNAGMYGKSNINVRLTSDWSFEDNMSNFFHNEKDTSSHFDFSPDGRYMAMACSTGYIKIYDMKTWVLKQKYSGNFKTKYLNFSNSPYYFVDFSSDGNMLIATTDKAIRIIDVAGEKVLSDLDESWNNDPYEKIKQTLISNDKSFLISNHEVRVIKWNGPNYLNLEENIFRENNVCFPNPASLYIEISLGANGRSPLLSDVRIYNIFGQNCNLTPSLSILGEGVRIDVSGLASGMYFVRMGDRVGKFVKL